jgi:hypothetical protein
MGGLLSKKKYKYSLRGELQSGMRQIIDRESGQPAGMDFKVQDFEKCDQAVLEGGWSFFHH